jgi:hypothetical protein
VLAHEPRVCNLCDADFLLELADFHFAVVNQGAYLTPAHESETVHAWVYGDVLWRRRAYAEACNARSLRQVKDRIPYNIAVIRNRYNSEAKIQHFFIGGFHSRTQHGCRHLEQRVVVVWVF